MLSVYIFISVNESGIIETTKVVVKAKVIMNPKPNTQKQKRCQLSLREVVYFFLSLGLTKQSLMCSGALRRMKIARFIVIIGLDPMIQGTNHFWIPGPSGYWAKPQVGNDNSIILIS